MENRTTNLTREELIAVLSDESSGVEDIGELDYYLKHAVHDFDLELLRLLMKAGANPNPELHSDCYLHRLMTRFLRDRTTKGDLVLEMLEELLKSGADANRIWGNNLRAYDYAVAWKAEPVAELLAKYGADIELRESI